MSFGNTSDPFSIGRLELDKAIQNARDWYHQLLDLETKPSSLIQKRDITWTKNRLQNILRTVEWDLEDLETSYEMSKRNAKMLHLDEKTLQNRKQYVDEIKAEIASMKDRFNLPKRSDNSIRLPLLSSGLRDNVGMYQSKENHVPMDHDEVDLWTAPNSSQTSPDSPSSFLSAEPPGYNVEADKVLELISQVIQHRMHAMNDLTDRCAVGLKRSREDVCQQHARSFPPGARGISLFFRELDKALHNARDMYHKLLDLETKPSNLVKKGEMSWAKNGFEKIIRAVEWDVEDLEDSYEMGKRNAKSLKLDEKVLQERKRYIDEVRAEVVSMKIRFSMPERPENPQIE
ncbi:unnamed protein product, partial [Darwinula stevensoni]